MPASLGRVPPVLVWEYWAGRTRRVKASPPTQAPSQELLQTAQGPRSPSEADETSVPVRHLRQRVLPSPALVLRREPAPDSSHYCMKSTTRKRPHRREQQAQAAYSRSASHAMVSE